MSREDKEAQELKRIEKFITQIGYDPEDDDRKPIGITNRSMQIAKTIKKSDLRGQLPDEWDKKNIDEYIKTYNTAFPYPHEQSLQMALEEGEKIILKRKRKSRLGIAPSLAIHLPIPFTIGLRKAYPVIFSDKGQFDWFIKNYPEFNLNKKGLHE